MGLIGSGRIEPARPVSLRLPDRRSAPVSSCGHTFERQASGPAARRLSDWVANAGRRLRV